MMVEAHQLLLASAAQWRPEITLDQLSFDQLRDLSAERGIDFATAVAYTRTAAAHQAFIERVRDFQGAAPKSFARWRPIALLVPNLGFGIDAKSQRVGETIAVAARELGIETRVVPTNPVGSLDENGAIIAQAIRDQSGRAAVLVSLSKGSAEVKTALARSGPALSSVLGWINVCGLTDGSPIVNLLLERDPSAAEQLILNWYSKQDPARVLQMARAAHDCGRGPGRTLSEPLEAPDNIKLVNVVAFPTRDALSYDHTRHFHSLMAEWGPNDGFGLLADMIHQPGAAYPVWGCDHYVDRVLDVRRFTQAVLAHLMPTDDPPSAPRPKGPEFAERASSSSESLAAPEDDWERLRHARQRHAGFAVGRYLQPPPMLFTRDGHNLFLGDMYRGQAAFLIGGGPSLSAQPLKLLERRGVLQCAMNNVAAVVRPQLWVSVDAPGHFADAIWRDPGILKFVPLCHMEKPLMVRDPDGELVPGDELVGDMPAVFGYRRNETFRPDQWLFEDTFNWGNRAHQMDELGNKGSRSVMYVALRLLFYLGVRRVFLLGCDFRMELGQRNYAFEQDRSRSSVRGNNSSYEILNSRLAALKPHFDREGFEIWNCTPNSDLTVFPKMELADAAEWAAERIPRRIDTAGMYDYEQRQREATWPAAAHPTTNRAPATPDFTLVVAVDPNSLRKLARVWPTWMRYKPQLRDTRVLLIHDEAIDPASPDCDFLRGHQGIEFRRWSMPSAASQREKMLTALVQGPAQWVETPWYLKLDVDVVATSDAEWILPEWFAEDEAGRTPVYVASPWGYTKPADAIERLDRWGDSIPELARHAPLHLPFDPRQELVRHPRVISWCFFASTNWTRSVAAYAPERLPCPSQDTYLFYCAARRRDHTMRIRMSQFGWQHVTGNLRRLARRCARSLSVDVDPQPAA